MNMNELKLQFEKLFFSKGTEKKVLSNAGSIELIEQKISSCTELS